jgi:hypothetical protein
MLWPFSKNTTLKQYAEEQLIQSLSTTTSSSSSSSSSSASTTTTTTMITTYQNYTIVKNPFWTAYPVWDQNTTTAIEFLKFYQCQKRILVGNPNLFDSCEHRLYTGTDNLDQVLEIHTFYGNSILSRYNSQMAYNTSGDNMNIEGSFLNNQYTPYRWSGFQSYPYNYLGRSTGDNYSTMTSPIIFNEDMILTLSLTQTPLTFNYQRAFSLTVPLPTNSLVQYPVSQSIPVRRFVEYKSSWNKYQLMGNPKDSYGMKYTVPIGMASLQRFANFPIFAGIRDY